MKTLINGEFSQFIDVNDRAVQYGDGLFETIAIIKGQPLLWDLHLKRLAKGAQKLNIPFPEENKFLEDFQQLNPPTNKNSVVKIILTRGQGGRGYRSPENSISTRILSLSPYPDYPQIWQKEGVHCELSPIRLGLNPFFAGIKHLNRLEQVMARSQWQDPAIAEKILCDLGGRVIEGTQSNLFIYNNGKLSTPLLNNCGIEGVMKEFIIQKAQDMGVPCQQRLISLADLATAEGLFLTNSLIGIWAVKQFQQTTYQIEQLPQQLIHHIRHLFN